MNYTRREFARRATAAIAVAAIAGCGGGSERTTETQTSAAPAQRPAMPSAAAVPPSATPTAAPPAPTPTRAAEPTPVPTNEPPSEPAPAAQDFPTGIQPARIEIPAIGVDATVIDLDLRGSEPEVPTNFAEVGWYVQTRMPGEIGPAVLAGHIDSRTGPAVFHRLDQLVAGDVIIITSDDADERTFTVGSAGQYTKEALPPEVFGVDGTKPDLRLITCGGTFDTASGHYRDNFVVYASAP